MTVSTPEPAPNRLSVVILTRNEASMIERCLNGIKGLADDILVVDSDSTDGTRALARQGGARVIRQPWLGWLAQRAVGIAGAQHDWVMILEADEIVTPRLFDSVRDVLHQRMSATDGYSMDRRDDFLGELLPRMRRRKKRLHFVRLFNRTQSRYDPLLTIHEEVRVPGTVHALDGALLHWRGFTIIEQVSRYAAYAPLESANMESLGQRVSVLSLAWRPFLRFGWCYILRGGFRLGARGFAHALMVASSEYMRYASAWERQHAPPVMHPSPKVIAAFQLREVSPPAVAPTATAAPLVLAPTSSASANPVHL